MENKILHSQKGFTLLETLIALAILLVAMTSILAVESGSINASARAKQLNVVAMLAKNTMVDTEFKIEGKAFEEIKTEDGGSFPAPYQDYRYTVKIKEVEFPTLNFSQSATPADSSGGGSSSSVFGTSSSAPTDSSGNDMSELLTKLITQFFSKALREVTVTILWKKGPGEEQFSVTTYWVDLNHEFQITE